jgi:hypothetical protein
MTFDFTHKSMDFQVIPEKIYGSWPSHEIRVKLDSHLPIIFCVSSFVLYWWCLVPIVFPATKPTTTKSIARAETWRDVHNFSLFVYSGFTCFATLYYLWSENQLFDWHAILCTPVEGTWLRPLSVAFTFSKMVEWLDTMFIVWLGKHPPKFLHKYHHATTFWLFCYVMNMPGAEKFGMLLNGGVHFLMYSHYWRSWPKPFVPLITGLQITQLATVIYTWYANPGECPNASFANAKVDLPFEFNMPYTMVPVFLLLFLKFFIDRFVLGKSKGSIKKNGGDDKNK